MILYQYCLYLLTLLCVGSYCGCFCYRWPYKERIYNQQQASHILGIRQLKQVDAALPKHSICPHCQHKLASLELIPVLGYLISKGHCRHCHSAISPDYILIELLILLVCAPLPWFFEQPIELALHVILFCSLMSVAFIDKNHYLIPDSCSFLILLCGLALVIDKATLPAHVNGAFLGFLLIYGIGKLYYAVRKHHGIGLGDAKLTGAITAWLGIFHLADLLVCASILGILYSICQSKLGTTQLAFGPFLAFSSIGLFYIQVLWQ